MVTLDYSEKPRKGFVKGNGKGEKFRRAPSPTSKTKVTNFHFTLIGLRRVSRMFHLLSVGIFY